MNPEGLVEATRRWVAEFVVRENMCPFARGLLEAGTLSIRIAPAGDAEALLHTLADESQRLHTLAPAELETSLVLHPGLFEAFEAQLDFLAAVEGLFEELGLDDALQVVSFHPDYRFEDAEPSDPANYTNRAPFGMFHLLRRASVEAVVAAHPDPDAIWRANVDRLHRLGTTQLEAALEDLRALAKAPA